MYKFLKVNDMNMVVSSVAPPCDIELKRGLSKLSIAHMIVQGIDSFEPFINIVHSCNKEELDVARIQFLHVSQEIKEKIKDDAHHLEFQLVNLSSWNKTIMQLTKSIQNDATILQKQCQNNPNSKTKAKNLDKVMLTLHEAMICLKHTPADEKNPYWTDELNQLVNKTSQIDEMHEVLRKTIGEHYDNLKNNLTALKDLDEKALESLKLQINNQQDVDFNKWERMDILLGDKSHLWKIVQNKKIKIEEVKKNSYWPLSESEAQEVKKFMIKLFKVSDNFKKQGVLDTLNNLSILSEYQGFKISRKANSQTNEEKYNKMVQDYEQEKKRLEERGEDDLNGKKNRRTYLKPLESKEVLMDRIIKDKKFLDEYAQDFLRLSQDFKNGIKQIATSLNIELGHKDNIVLTLKNHSPEIIVGTWSDSPVRVVIYKDNSVKEVSENAVYLTTLEKEDCINGIPELTIELKNRTFSRGSNFESLSQALLELKDEYVQTHLCGKNFIIDNQLNLEQITELKNNLKKSRI